MLVAVRDLLFRSRIEESARRAGVAIRLAPRDRPLAEAIAALGGGTVLADLNQPGALEALREAAAAGAVRAVGYLGHLQQELMTEAAAAGIEVLTRGQLSARLDALVAGAGEPTDPRGGPAA
jgi:hypothetical protein